MESQASPALDPGVAAGAPPRFHLLSKPSPDFSQIGGASVL